MTPARLAAACDALLGGIDGRLVVVAPHASAAVVAFRARAADAADTPVGAVIVWLGERGESERRTAVLADVRARLPVGAPLVVVDYNQPRTRGRRWANALELWLRGVPSSRARYLVAREVARSGFTVERARLADGERLQLVRAVRAA